MSYQDTGRGAGPPDDVSRNDGFHGSGGYSGPQQGSGGYSVPQQGTGGYSVPQPGSGGYSVPQQGSGGYSVPQQSYPYGYGYGQYGYYSTPGTQGPQSTFPVAGVPPPSLPYHMGNIAPQGVPPPHTYYDANFGDNSAAAEPVISPANQNIDTRQQTHHHSEETLTRTNDRKLSAPSEESQRRTERSKSKSSESRYAQGAETDSSVDRGGYHGKPSGYSHEAGKNKGTRQNPGTQKLDIGINDLLQDERLKSVLFAGISKATAKLELSLKSSEGETSEIVALADDSSRMPRSQQICQASSAADPHLKPKSILKRKTGDIEGGAVTNAIDKLSALGRTLHLLQGKTDTLKDSGGTEKSSKKDRQKQSAATKSSLGLLASYTDSGDDENTDKSDKKSKKQSPSKQSATSTQPFWSVGTTSAVAEMAEKETESFDVKEKLYEQWRQSINRTTERQRTPTKEKEMSQVDPFFQKKIPTQVLAAASEALKKADKNDGDELDSTVQNILQSIGFNFDLSQRMQELARQKKKQHDTLSPGVINQSATFLGKSEGLVQDVRAALFSKNQEQGNNENVMEARASTQKSSSSYERSASPSRWGDLADEEKNYGHRGRSPGPIDKRGADIHREKKRSDLQLQDTKHEKTLDKSYKNKDWEEISPERDDWTEREAREIADKIIRLSYERDTEVRQQPFSREKDAATLPRSSMGDENWQSKKNVPGRHGERSLFMSERFRDEPNDEYFYPDDNEYAESSKAVPLVTQFSSKRKEDLSSGLIPSLRLPSQSGSTHVENLRVTSRAVYNDGDQPFAESRRTILPSESDQRIGSGSPVYRQSRSPVYRDSQSPIYRTSQSPKRTSRKRSASPLTHPISKERKVYGDRGDYIDSPTFYERSLERRKSPVARQSFDQHTVFNKASEGGMWTPERIMTSIIDDFFGRESARTSQERRKTRSPSDRPRSKSPGRQRSRSPGRQRPRSLDRHRSRSPGKQRSQDRRTSRSPGRQLKSAGRQRSRSPKRQGSRSRSIVRLRKSPGEQRAPESVRCKPSNSQKLSDGRLPIRQRQNSNKDKHHKAIIEIKPDTSKPKMDRKDKPLGHAKVDLSKLSPDERKAYLQKLVQEKVRAVNQRQNSNRDKNHKASSEIIPDTRKPKMDHKDKPLGRANVDLTKLSPEERKAYLQKLVQERMAVNQRQNSNRDKNHKASSEIKPDTSKPKLDHKDKPLDRAKVDLSKLSPEERKAYLQKLIQEKGQAVNQRQNFIRDKTLKASSEIKPDTSKPKLDHKDTPIKHAKVDWSKLSQEERRVYQQKLLQEKGQAVDQRQNSNRDIHLKSSNEIKPDTSMPKLGHKDELLEDAKVDMSKFLPEEMKAYLQKLHEQTVDQTKIDAESAIERLADFPVEEKRIILTKMTEMTTEERQTFLQNLRMRQARVTAMKFEVQKLERDKNEIKRKCQYGGKAATKPLYLMNTQIESLKKEIERHIMAEMDVPIDQHKLPSSTPLPLNTSKDPVKQGLRDEKAPLKKQTKTFTDVPKATSMVRVPSQSKEVTGKPLPSSSQEKLTSVTAVGGSPLIDAGGVVKKTDKQNKDVKQDSQVNSLSHSSSKQKVYYEYYDSGNHWCKYCSYMCSSIEELLQHNNGKKHRARIAEEKKPWKDTNEKSAPRKVGVSQTRRIKGVEMMFPANGCYCSVCKVFCGDFTDSADHLKSDKHYDMYMEFCKQNPLYEKALLLEKTTSQARKQQNVIKTPPQPILSVLQTPPQPILSVLQTPPQPILSVLQTPPLPQQPFILETPQLPLLKTSPLPWLPLRETPRSLLRPVKEVPLPPLPTVKETPPPPLPPEKETPLPPQPKETIGSINKIEIVKPFKARSMGMNVRLTGKNSDSNSGIGIKDNTDIVDMDIDDGEEAENRYKANIKIPKLIKPPIVLPAWTPQTTVISLSEVKMKETQENYKQPLDQILTVEQVSSNVSQAQPPELDLSYIPLPEVADLPDMGTFELDLSYIPMPEEESEFPVPEASSEPDMICTMKSLQQVEEEGKRNIDDEKRMMVTDVDAEAEKPVVVTPAPEASSELDIICTMKSLQQVEEEGKRNIDDEKRMMVTDVDAEAEKPVVVTPAPEASSKLDIICTVKSLQQVEEEGKKNIDDEKRMVVTDVDGEAEKPVVVTPGPEASSEPDIICTVKSLQQVEEEGKRNIDDEKRMVVTDVDGEAEKPVVVTPAPEASSEPDIICTVKSLQQVEEEGKKNIDDEKRMVVTDVDGEAEKLVVVTPTPPPSLINTLQSGTAQREREEDSNKSLSSMATVFDSLGKTVAHKSKPNAHTATSMIVETEQKKDEIKANLAKEKIHLMKKIQTGQKEQKSEEGVARKVIAIDANAVEEKPVIVTPTPPPPSLINTLQSGTAQREREEGSNKSLSSMATVFDSLRKTVAHKSKPNAHTATSMIVETEQKKDEIKANLAKEKIHLKKIQTGQKEQKSEEGGARKVIAIDANAVEEKPVKVTPTPPPPSLINALQSGTAQREREEGSKNALSSLANVFVSLRKTVPHKSKPKAHNVTSKIVETEQKKDEIKANLAKEKIHLMKKIQTEQKEQKSKEGGARKVIAIDANAVEEKPVKVTPTPPPPSLINTRPPGTAQRDREEDSKKTLSSMATMFGTLNKKVAPKSQPKASTTTSVVLKQKIEGEIKARLAKEKVILKKKQEVQREQKSEEEGTKKKRIESGSLSVDKSDAIRCDNQEAEEDLSGNVVINKLETTDMKQVDVSLTSVEYDDQKVMASEHLNIATSTVVEETAQVEKSEHGQNDPKEVEARPDVEIATSEVVLKEVLPLKVEDLVTVTEGKSVSNVNLEIGDSAYFADSHAVRDQEDKSAGEGMLRKMAASAKSECEVLDNELVVLSGVAEDSQGENYTGHIQDSAGSSEKNTASISTMEKVQQHEVMSETKDELSSSGSNREYELQEVSSSNTAEVESYINDCITAGASQDKMNITSPEDDIREQMDTDDIVVVGQGISITTPVDGIQKETNITDLVTVSQEEGNITHPDNMEQMDTDDIVVVGQGISITTPVDGIQKETNITDLVTVIQEEGNITHPDSMEQMDTDDVVVGHGISIAESIDSIQGGTIITGPVPDCHEDTKIASAADNRKEEVSCVDNDDMKEEAIADGVGNTKEELTIIDSLDDLKEDANIADDTNESEKEKSIDIKTGPSREEINISSVNSKESINIFENTLDSGDNVSKDLVEKDKIGEVEAQNVGESTRHMKGSSVVDQKDVYSDQHEVPDITTANRGRKSTRSKRGRKAAAEIEVKMDGGSLNVNQEGGSESSLHITENVDSGESEGIAEVSVTSTGSLLNKPSRKPKGEMARSSQFQGRVTRSRAKKGQADPQTIEKTDVEDIAGDRMEAGHQDTDSHMSLPASETETVGESGHIQSPLHKSEGDSTSEATIDTSVTKNDERSHSCLLTVSVCEGSSDSDATITEETEDPCALVNLPIIECEDVVDSMGEGNQANLTGPGGRDESIIDSQQAVVVKFISRSEDDGDVISVAFKPSSGQEQKLVDDNIYGQQSGNDNVPQQHCHGHTGGQSRDPPMSGVVEDEDESANTMMVSVAETDSQVIESDTPPTADLSLCLDENEAEDDLLLAIVDMDEG